MTAASGSPAVPAEHSGWYLVAFAEELAGPVASVVVGRKQLLVLTLEGQPPAVYDATCPHRGANLAFGGVPQGEHVICPFHGKAISLGIRPDRRYCVRRYPSIWAGSALFVCLDESKRDDCGFEALLVELARDHRFVPGGTLRIRVRQEVVIENAFDLDHFSKVHRIARVTTQGFGLSETGAAFCQASFLVRTPGWERSAQSVVQSRFYARAYSPSVVVTELGPPEDHHVVITGATAEGGESQVRIVYGFPIPPGGGDPPPAVVSALVEGGRKAMQDDRVVWEHLDPDVVALFDDRDDPVQFFHAFCGRFGAIDVSGRRDG